MCAEGLDPSLINDFLTESGELIERLDADLVRLEREPAAVALLDQIFRALHTIKGAASFLGLPNLTAFAHAAEDALNRLRTGEVAVDASVIDAMLKSVDVLRGMLDQVREGVSVTAGPDDLIARMHEISTRTAGPAIAPSAVAKSVSGGPARTAPDCEAGKELAGSRRALSLGSEKLDLIPFMGDELRNASEDLTHFAELLDQGMSARQVAEKISAAVSILTPTAEFFSVEGLTGLVSVLNRLGHLVAEADGALLDVAADRVRHSGTMLRDVNSALQSGEELFWTQSELESRLLNLSNGSGSCIPPAVAASVESPSRADGCENARQPSELAASARKAEPAASTRSDSAASGADQTVRVEVSRLEALLNLVGEMVLTKNHMLGLARQLRSEPLAHELQESVAGAVSNLDRLTSELQVSVMRTRMQPLGKLFGKYPRIVRDLARATGKQIEIEISGNETEVDKSVLEALSDPMVHILRNSADHGIESPESRIAAGKAPAGLIRLSAEHQGGHVRVTIGDDGKGVDPEIVGRKAVEKGLITSDQLSQMTIQEIVNLVFTARFSTAEKVSDMSGRGVGMDVVRTNISRLGGTIHLTSTKGQGTVIEVLIPLTVAIMPAMLVGIGASEYAVPLACIIEIVRLETAAPQTIGGKPVIRLRESVLPLVDMNVRLAEPACEGARRFAVVVEAGQQRAGLVVDQLIGQQEVVIKPLDDRYATGGPFSGATIRENGDVSLIVDPIQLIRTVQSVERSVA